MSLVCEQLLTERTDGPGYLVGETRHARPKSSIRRTHQALS